MCSFRCLSNRLLHRLLPSSRSNAFLLLCSLCLTHRPLYDMHSEGETAGETEHSDGDRENFFFFCLATCSVSDSDSEGTAEEMIASWDSVWSTERMAANVQAQPQHAHVCVLFNQRVSEAEQSSGLNQGRLCWSDQL